MPHLVILYTGNLDAVVDMPALCRELADAMLTVRDEAGAQVFPTGGTRVFAYPAPHFAVADGGAAGGSAVATRRLEEWLPTTEPGLSAGFPPISLCRRV